MQTVSALYEALFDDNFHCKEHKAVIAGVEYGEADIVGVPEVTRAMFAGNTPGIGGCVAGVLDLSIIPKGEIPKMAEIRMFTRLVGEVNGVRQASEWIPKGVFFIDTRTTDWSSGVMTIRAYDAMLKAEQSFLTEVTEDDWPKPMGEVVAEIAQRMGVELDSRTTLSAAFRVGLPLEYTMREVMQHIAVAMAGNWYITDAGKLRLVSLAQLPVETGYLVSEDGDVILFGDVRILV